MSFKQRYRETFREALYKQYTPENIRLGDWRSIPRQVDAEYVVKAKVRFNKTGSQKIAKLVNSTGEDDEMDDMKDTKSWREIDARDFNLEDNVAQIYFDTYNEGFYGEPYPSNNDNMWICPHCNMKYRMSLKDLPLRCNCCNYITPIGRMSEDGVMKRY